MTQSSRGASISVVIPAYNSRFLEETITSVYAQTVLPDQVIVVDDGSTDATPDHLERLARELPSSFMWRRKENGGEASARNFGVRLATGTYVAFLDHDDVWHPEKLERQLQQFASDQDLACSFTGYSLMYRGYQAKGPERSPEPIVYENWDPEPDLLLEQLLTGNCLIATMSALMIRSEVLARLPPFDEGLRVGSDWQLYLELVVRRMKMGHLPDVLVEYRWHGSNLSRDLGHGWEYLCVIYDKFYEDHASELSNHMRARVREIRAFWHMQSAIHAIRQGDRSRARRHILTAAQARPRSIRPGWVRMLGLGPPPGADSDTWPV